LGDIKSYGKHPFISSGTMTPHPMVSSGIEIKTAYFLMIDNEIKKPVVWFILFVYKLYCSISSPY
jgi:hypothetical protein